MVWPGAMVAHHAQVLPAVAVGNGLRTVPEPVGNGLRAVPEVPQDLEQWQVLLGTANGLALVNVGNALPTAHLFTVSAEWEE